MANFKKPAGWDKLSPIDRLTYQRGVEQIDKRMNAMLDTLRPKVLPGVAEQNKAEVMSRVSALSPLERERFDELARERVANGGRV